MKDRDLDLLSRRMRVAVAAACLERALDFYRNGNFSYRIRNAPGSVLKGDANADLPEHALELAWTYAATGAVDPDAPDAVIAGLNTDADDCDPEDMVVAAKTATDSVCDLMRTISDETPAKAKRTARGAICAVWDGVAAVEGRTEADRAEADEDALQAQILARAQSLGDKPPSRADFADLIAKALPWRAHLASFRKTYRHR